MAAGGERTVQIDKSPRDFELVRQVRRQRLNAEGFCGIVAAIKNIHSQFLGQGERPVRSLAGDEGVHAFARRLFQSTARAAGHHADAPANLRPAGQQPGRHLQRPAQSLRQFRAFQTSPRLATNESAFFEEKRLALLQSQGGAKPRVVAQARMRVERQVRTVNRQIVLQQQPQQFVTFPGPRMARTPKQPVMNQQQVGLGRDGEPDRGQARVHRRGQARDRAAVFHLQPVDRPFPITEFIRAQQPIAMAHQRGQRNVRHGRHGNRAVKPSKTGKNCSSPIEFCDNQPIVRSF